MTETVFLTRGNNDNETVFHTQASTGKLEALLIETVGPKTFHLHHTVGGPGWCILNTAKTVKTVVVNDPQLASFLILKLT